MKHKIASLILAGTCAVGVVHAAHDSGYVAAVGSVPPAGEYVADQWNFYKGECTSYVAYRLNAAGLTFHNQWRVSDFGGLPSTPPLSGKSPWDTDRWSDAWEWRFKAEHIGLVVNTTPAANALYCSTASTWGHVAFVDSVSGGGSANISEYNRSYDHLYTTRTVTADGVNSFFIHFTPSGGGSISISDNFQDGIKDVTIWGVDIGTSSALLHETAGALLFSTSSSTGTRTMQRPCLTSAPYDEDWQVSLDVGNSAAPTTDSGWIEIGLSVADADKPLEPAILRFRLYAADFYSGGLGRGFFSGGSQIGYRDTYSAGSTTHGSLLVTFNKMTKVITTFYDLDGPSNGHNWSKLQSVGLAGSGGDSHVNLGMASDSSFEVAVYGESMGNTVSPGVAWADNFVLQFGAVPPRVIVDPSNHTVSAGANATFSVVASGGSPLLYQWRFNGQNITGATNATLAVTNARASDSGSYSVRVANTAGSVVSTTAHLAVLADGAGGTPPEQVTTRPVPPREPSQNNLVLVTHGWQALGQHATWVDEMANAIEARLTSEGKADWQVVPIHWNEAAWGLPVMALSGARIVGALYGAEFAQTQWQHIHLIAHSAGSVFIEAFAKEIKAVWPATDIHCTYLDPYLSIVWGLGRETYGQNADWSDSYFAADETATLTRGKLVNAHNVEVTGLDPDARSMPLGGALSSHGWPYRFYAQTVSGAVPGAGQYGFSRSKEAAGWDQRGDYPINNSPVILPTSASPSPFQGEIPFSGGAVLALDGIPLNTSGDGVSLIGSFAFSMSTPPVLPMSGETRRLSPSATDPFGTTDSAQPAWLAVAATVTSEVNFVQFDAEFTSPSAAEGLLTIFWNTNQIGMIDERTSTPALQTYRFELPSKMSAGVYSLSFRLDSFSSTESSVVITNVTTGVSGIVDPIVLGWASSTSNVWPTLEVTAPTGFTYLVQTSTNLMEWTPQGFHLHTNAVMQFADPDSTNCRQRFYRAVLP